MAGNLEIMQFVGRLFNTQRASVVVMRSFLRAKTGQKIVLNLHRHPNNHLKECVVL